MQVHKFDPTLGPCIPVPLGFDVIEQTPTEVTVFGHLPDGSNLTQHTLEVTFRLRDGRLHNRCRRRESGVREHWQTKKLEPVCWGTSCSTDWVLQSFANGKPQ